MFRHAAAVFVALVLSLLAVLNVLQADRSFSEHENRYLQEFPAFSLERLVSGTFGREFDQYIQDQFPFRDRWIALKTLAERAAGRRDNGRIYFGRDGFLLVMDPESDPDRLARNSEALRQLLATLMTRHPGLSASILLVPTAPEVRPDLLPPHAPVPSPEFVAESVRSLLGCETPGAVGPGSCSVVDLLSALRTAAAGPDAPSLYYRTDHHWTTAGAFEAYRAWARAAGIQPSERDDFEIRPVSDRFFGTTWSSAHVLSLPPDRIDAWTAPWQDGLEIRVQDGPWGPGSLYHPEFLGKKDQYAYFLGGNQASVDIRTGAGTGRTLLLIRDSYANSVVPFLVRHFDRLLVLDPRHLNVPVDRYLDGLPDFEPTDFLFLARASSFGRNSEFGRLAGGAGS